MPDKESGNLKDFLDPRHEYGFGVYTQFRLQDGKIEFDDIRPILREAVEQYVGYTYVWIGVNNHYDCWRALYVGSSRSIIGRHQGHIDDLNNQMLIDGNKMLAKKNAEIRKIILELGRVDVYVKPSGMMVHLDEEIPAYYADELAFIKKLKPCWNIENNKYIRPLTWYSE